MDTIDTLIEQMHTFGFSPYETKAYCALLQKSPLNGYEVSRATSIPPSKIYETLQRLHNKGAVLVYQSDPIRYAPVPYPDLLARLREHTTNAFTTIENQLKDYHHTPDTSLTYTITGTSNILDTMSRIIFRSTRSILATLSDHDLNLLAEPLRDAYKRGVELHIVINGTFKLDIPHTYDITLYGDNDHTPPFTNPLSSLVSDQTETITANLTATQDIQAIWTHNPIIALHTANSIKNEIMHRVLAHEIGDKKYHRLRHKHPDLKNLLRL